MAVDVDVCPSLSLQEGTCSSSRLYGYVFVLRLCARDCIFGGIYLEL